MSETKPKLAKQDEGAMGTSLLVSLAIACVCLYVRVCMCVCALVDRSLICFAHCFAEDLPPHWVVKMSRSRGVKYYFNTKTRESRWEKPLPEHSHHHDDHHSHATEEKTVRAAHILAKHKDSRRPSSWRQDVITRTKEEAIEIIQSEPITNF